MKFTETRLTGVLLIETDKLLDDRGSFEVAWHADAFRARGLESRLAQCNVATNPHRGTIRGMHYQVPPCDEVKLIWPVRGAVFDVAVDLRPDSPTFHEWVGVELAAGTGRMLYVPRGFAHGYQTLSDDTDVFYLVSAPYSPPHQRGIRWDDPAIGIEWPLGPPTVMSQRDTGLPPLAR